MMENIKNYGFSNKLNEFFKDKIKLSFVSKQSVIIITTNDECYEFRRDSTVKTLKNSLIALSHDPEKIKDLIKKSLVEELSFKNVIDIKSGWSHSIALTSDHKLYSWGRNVKGVIGNGDENTDTFKPELNKFLIDESIIDMCCGYYHTLVLTIKREVYYWGSLGSYRSTTPELLTNESVKAISCGSEHSLVLTEKGQVYELGKRDWLNPETREDNELLELSKPIEKIACGFKHSLLWSSEGYIYICGLNKTGELGTGNQNNVSIPHLINFNGKFTDIASNIFHKFTIALSEDTFYIWGEYGNENIKEPKEITDKKLKSFNDIFESHFQITYKPTEGKIIQFYDDYIQNDKYNNFTQIKKLGEGSFGEVFEVSDNENMKFAIKKIKFVNENEKEFWKELETSPIISELSNKNIVEYFDLWLENDSKNLTLNIKMELCDVDLFSLIKEIKGDSNFLSNKTLTPLGYYIASGIFIEILEGVNYLHNENPPIIHRDLNPSNIMLKFEKLNKCFIKITDLGLATIHESVMKHTKGDRGYEDYVAPEVKQSSDYDTRADIYSLGIVLEKLFCFDIRNTDIPIDSQCEPILIDKYKETDNLWDNMTKRNKNTRCKSIEEEILKKKQLWSLNVYELNNKIDFENLLENNERNGLCTYKLLQARQFYDLLIKNGKYGEKFIEKSRKTEESYGEVFEVSKNDQKIEFAMKKIKLAKENEKELMEKLKNSPLTFKLSHRNIIEVSDVWLENDRNFKLYILMELYDMSLFEMINEIKTDSNFNPNKILTSLGYFIASEIFIGILQGVYFIHKQSPAIIHRYLNPWNIMLKIDKQNIISVKIADTGLETIHEYINQSETGKAKTQKYLAPEISENSKKYDLSADLFSLGMILEELFQMDRDRNYDEQEEPSTLLSKYKNLKNSWIFMTHKRAIMRSAYVEDILDSKHLWALNANEFNEEFKTVFNTYRSKESFVFKLLKNIL